LSIANEMLDTGETVIWRGSPTRGTVLLQSFAGVWFALIFGAFAIVMLNFGVPLIGFPIVLLALACALVIIPPLLQLRKLPSCEYMVTNKRLFIKTGIKKSDLWFAELYNVKEIVVKIGFIDKILGTGKLYPITAEYPYAPKLRAYSRGGMTSLKKVYNITTGAYDEIPEIELYRKSVFHPHLEGIKQPYDFQNLLRQQCGK
jgi:hypothetical protein